MIATEGQPGPIGPECASTREQTERRGNAGRTDRRPGIRGLLWAGLALAAGAAAQAPRPPVAPVRAVTEDYFGTKVTDGYRWMEDRHAAEFLAWVKAENDYARATLGAIPHRDALLKRIEELDAAGTRVMSVQRAPHVLAYLKRGPEDDVYKLYVRTDGGERLLLDPNAPSNAGQHSAIDYIQLSPDGRFVAVGVSQGGSEESVMRILETSSGSTLAERIDRVEYGSPAWGADGKSFFYNRFAKVEADAPETAKYLNSHVYRHRLGERPREDELVLAAGQNPEVRMTAVDYPFVVTAPGSGQAIAVINHGAAPELTLYITREERVKGVHSHWRPLADVDDAVKSVALHGDEIYLLSHKGAPRYQIVRVRADSPDIAAAAVVVPESSVVIEEFGVAADALYFRVLDAGVQRLRRLDFATGKVTDLDAALAGGIDEFATTPDLPGVIFPVQSWIVPPRWFQYDSPAAGARDIALLPAWHVDTSAYEVAEVTARAADGTAIPLSLIHARQFSRDRAHTVWLRGYGAYGLSLTPGFVPGWLALLERGGVVAVAHVRGGGEFGESWHEGGKQATKPNTYRDLIACAEYLIAQDYTTAARLAIQGGSAGGITVGMAMTERPDLFRVVLSDVGDSNTLRAEQETDGDANALEYGSVKTEPGFRALLAVDAVQHVKDGTPYPAVLLTTGINDPRVAPWQPGKMAARLQAATSSGRPVLLRVDYDAGHGFGSTRRQRDELLADQLAFVFWQVGIPEFQPTPAR
jgi:prolyl oligopeptidase